MKVSDLKAELKKRNLPVSGAKPQLIERLKPYSESATSNSSSATSSSSSAASSSIVSSQHTQDDSIPSGTFTQ
uniref:SAP domain-containing protein n=1 Tax=Rhodnius prolixus TaxID=13249 RepID=T1HTW0_RHOPR